MNNIIDSILIVNNYLIVSRKRNFRHVIMKYMAKKISSFISRKMEILDDRTINVYVPSNRVNIR